MATTRQRVSSGFVMLELPIALALMMLAGLLVAFVFRQFTGPAPWYAWLCAALVLPGITVVGTLIGLMGEAALRWRAKPSDDKP